MMKMLTIALAAENLLRRKLYGIGLQGVKVVKMADGSKYVVKDLYKCFIKSKGYLNNTDKWSISEDNKYKMIFTFK